MTTSLKTFRLTFFVPGSPAPQGSKRHVGNGRMIEQSRNVGPWRERIAIAAHNFAVEHPELELPVSDRAIASDLLFILPRLKSMTTNKPTPPAIRRPDLDKLERAIGDALTGIIFTDDAAITSATTGKRYAMPNETPGVHIRIETLP